MTTQPPGKTSSVPPPGATETKPPPDTGNNEPPSTVRGKQETMQSLKVIDDQIRAAIGGDRPGSGLYRLLSTLAEQTFGIPRSAFIPPQGDKQE